MRLLGNDSGFTLFEILVAVVVLTIGLLSTTTLTLGILRGNVLSNRMATATTLAQDGLEAVKNMGFAGAVSLTEDFGSLKNYGPSKADYSSYKRVTTITTVTTTVPGPPQVTEKPVKTATVTVSWKSSTRSVTLTTTLAQ